MIITPKSEGDKNNTLGWPINYTSNISFTTAKM